MVERTLILLEFVLVDNETGLLHRVRLAARATILPAADGVVHQRRRGRRRSTGVVAVPVVAGAGRRSRGRRGGGGTTRGSSSLSLRFLRTFRRLFRTRGSGRKRWQQHRAFVAARRRRQQRFFEDVGVVLVAHGVVLPRVGVLVAVVRVIGFLLLSLAGGTRFSSLSLLDLLLALVDALSASLSLLFAALSFGDFAPLRRAAVAITLVAAAGVLAVVVAISGQVGVVVFVFVVFVVLHRNVRKMHRGDTLPCFLFVSCRTMGACCMTLGI